MVGVRRHVGELCLVFVLDRPLLLSGRRGYEQAQAVDFGELDDEEQEQLLHLNYIIP